MLWHNHPAYVRVRENLVRGFRDRVFVFRKLKHVVFVCGGFESTRRLDLVKYLGKWCPEALVFQADDVWTEIAARNPGLNALALEEQLASLADMLLIIVESPGTYAELGAFSISPQLRPKLLPIIDASHRNKPSFINSGPVKWVDLDSSFGPTIYVRLESILEAGKAITDRLDLLPTPRPSMIKDLAAHPKHLLFLVHDLVAIVGPTTADHVAFLVRAILGREPDMSVESLLGLGKAIGLLRSFAAIDQIFYLATSQSYDAEPFVTKRHFNLNRERAKALSVLETIGPALDVLRAGTDCA